LRPFSLPTTIRRDPRDRRVTYQKLVDRPTNARSLSILRRRPAPQFCTRTAGWRLRCLIAQGHRIKGGSPIGTAIASVWSLRDRFGNCDGNDSGAVVLLDTRTRIGGNSHSRCPCRRHNSLYITNVHRSRSIACGRSLLSRADGADIEATFCQATRRVDCTAAVFPRSPGSQYSIQIVRQRIHSGRTKSPDPACPVWLVLPKTSCLRGEVCDFSKWLPVRSQAGPNSGDRKTSAVSIDSKERPFQKQTLGPVAGR